MNPVDKRRGRGRERVEPVGTESAWGRCHCWSTGSEPPRIRRGRPRRPDTWRGRGSGDGTPRHDRRPMGPAGGTPTGLAAADRIRLPMTSLWIGFFCYRRSHGFVGWYFIVLYCIVIRVLIFMILWRQSMRGFLLVKLCWEILKLCDFFFILKKITLFS